tara:strand:+ start:82 stop:549 length:468 start_codon:yes stop_codon:yes gene_type:complete
MPVQREQRRLRQLTAISRLRAMRAEQALAAQTAAALELTNQLTHLITERELYRQSLSALAAPLRGESELFPELHEQHLMNQLASSERLQQASDAHKEALLVSDSAKKQLIDAQVAETLIVKARAKVERVIRGYEHAREHMDTTDAQLARREIHGF